MEWENKLLSVPAGQWVVEQAVVFDWHDGPRAGICALAFPRVEFAFEFVAEEPDPDGIDLRTVRLKELPKDSVISFIVELERLGARPRTRPVWAPIWKFANDEARHQADHLVEALANRTRPTTLLISTTDMVRVRNCWRETPVRVSF